MKKVLFLVIIIIVVYVIISPSFILYSQSKKNILIIHSYNHGYEWTDNIHKGLVDNLLTLKNIEIYTEYLDANRKALTEEYLNYFENFLKIKYENIKFDLIIISDDEALDFILKRRRFLFKDIPIVFCGINDFDKSILMGQKNITGVNEEKPIKENINLILSINDATGKKLSKIGIIAGPRISDKKTLAAFKKNIKLIPSNIVVELFNDMDFDDVLNRLSNYTENDVIFCISYILFSKGIRYNENDVIEKLAGKTKAKIFVINDVLVKDHVFGGYVVTSYDHGEDAAKIAIRILKGEDINKINVKMQSIKKYVFNYDYLVKYKIPLAILPQNSILVNLKEGNNYRDYYKNFNQENILSYELFQNYGLVMLLIDPENGNIIDANQRARLFYGYDNITNMKIQQINTLSPEEIQAEMKKAKQLNKNYFNFKHRLANGQIRDVEVYSYPVIIFGKKVLFSIVIDVTEKLQIQKLKEKQDKRLIITLSIILILFFISTIFITVYFFSRKKYIKELEIKNNELFKANQEIKTLQGIIPICAICKKIRTDDGYWQTVENYISEHSTALFSHSICPECAKKYYDMDIYKLKESKN